MKYIVLIFFLFHMAQAQQLQSIHQQHRLKYKLPKQPSLYSKSAEQIVRLKPKEIDTPAKVVFGYLPDWEYLSARDNLQYDLLSHIAAFDFDVSAAGDITNPSYWPWTDVINEAHSNGVKMIMTVVNFDTDEIHTILTNSTVKNNLFENIKSTIQTYDLQGVNVDFENVASDDRGALLNGFMADLTDYIHSEIPGSEVSFAGPAVNWGGWDLPGLAASCDYIFIMGYNYYGSWSETSGPCSPLTGGYYNITNTVEVQYGEVTQNNPEKLILGIPYYGNRWMTENTQAYSTAIDHIESPRYRTAIEEAENHGLLWDTASQTSWYTYQESGNNYQVWFDTDSSLGLKYDYADSKLLRGVGMWALGYDGERTELWDELRDHYGSPSAIINEKNIPSQFKLFRNYPNPFNPKTIITYQLTVGTTVDLSIYNILGQKIVTLVSEKQNAGFHSFEWDASGFSGAVYFCKLQTEKGFFLTRKLVLLK